MWEEMQRLEGCNCRPRNTKDSCYHHQLFPRTGKGRISPSAFRGSMARLTPWFWTSGFQKAFLLFPVTQIVFVCYSSPRESVWSTRREMHAGVALETISPKHAWQVGKLRPRFAHRAVGSGKSSSHTVEDHVRVRTGGILKFLADSACAPCHQQNEPSAQHGAPGLHDTAHPAGVLQGLCKGASSLGRHHCPPLSTALPPQADWGPSRPSFKVKQASQAPFFHAVGSALAGMSIFHAAVHWKGFHVKRCQARKWLFLLSYVENIECTWRLSSWSLDRRHQKSWRDSPGRWRQACQ